MFHGAAIATLAALYSTEVLGWNAAAATFAWVLGALVSCIPVARSVLVFFAVKSIATWWVALLAVIALGVAGAVGKGFSKATRV